MNNKISKISGGNQRQLDQEQKIEKQTDNDTNSLISTVDNSKLVKQIPEANLANRLDKLKRDNINVRVNKGVTYFNPYTDIQPKQINILEYSSSEKAFNANGKITPKGKTIYTSLLLFVHKLMFRLGIASMEQAFGCRHLSLAMMKGLLTKEDLDSITNEQELTQTLDKCLNLKDIEGKNKIVLEQLEKEYRNLFKVDKQDIIKLFLPKSLKDISLEMKKNKFDALDSDGMKQKKKIIKNPSLLLLPENDKILKEITEKNSDQIKNLKILSKNLLALGCTKEFETLESLSAKGYFTQKDTQIIEKMITKGRYSVIVGQTYKKIKADIPITDSIKINATSEIVKFSESGFADALHYMCKSVIDSPDTNEERFMIITPNHAMSFGIEYKDNKISIMFYDPCETNIYKIVELSSVKYAKQLMLSDFISTKRLLAYDINNPANVKKGVLNDELKIMFVRSKK